MSADDTVYDLVAAEANGSAPVRATSRQVAADEFDDHAAPLTPCSRGGCWHWRRDVECPRDPWPICECGDLALLDHGACPHGTGLCASCSDRCHVCEVEKADARDEADRRYDRENGAA